PTEIKVQLTWDNGTPQNWVTFSTTGHSAGDVYLLDVQAANTVTQTRSYPWKIEVQATLQDSSVIHFIHTGSTLVVVNDNPLSPNPFGNGWSLAGVDQLLTDTNGIWWVYGNHGTRYFKSGPNNTYISPANDLGTLVKNVDNSYTYTAKDQTRWNFNFQGKLASVVD